MIVFDWFSEFPVPLIFLMILAVCLLIVEGFSFVSRRFDPKDRTNDNIGRAALAFVSSAFIFVGAFTIITSWTEDAKLHAAAEHEVVAAMTIVREIRVLAPADTTVNRALTDYAHAVLEGETGRTGELASTTQAEDAFVQVEEAIVDVAEKPGVGSYRAGEVFDSLSDLKVARQDRVGELSNTVALPLILLLLIMASLNLIGIGLFPSGTSRGLKRTFGFIVGVAVAAMICSVVVLESVQFIQPRLSQPLETFIAEVAK